ncbi:GNAT family N-acetyltransferase [Paenibacillus sambharensis]|uniref:GNAT family N-acetyltransferase n=2 Tax=Paenibacillus sambharensis TaxID=1803190 RepID=A0A2W1LDV6_9BACL|nr:GNAT family N-acetyltransferase [Paenibacillus sambharensis]
MSTMHEIREMVIEDYPSLIELWNRTEGLAIGEADSEEAIDHYLQRNPGMSFVCADENKIIGTVMCGHDGRRGYLYHVAVDQDYRGRNLAQELVKRSLSRLSEEGIHRCHILVIADNEIGKHFWTKTGWNRRDGILLYSHET